jgi:hypothetical protein
LNPQPQVPNSLIMTPLYPKFRILGLFIVFTLFSTFVKAQDARDSLIGDGDHFLEMRGKVFKSMGQQRDEDKKGLDSAEIRVTNEVGKEVIFGLTDEKGRLAFRLPLGRRFTINISKKGYVKKMISVDTHVPPDLDKDFTFTFDIDIFEKVSGLDVSVLDQPVAKVSFRITDKNFSYDAAYTNKVNAGLQKMYREYYNLEKKTQANDTLISKSGNTKSDTTKKTAPYNQTTKPHQK